MWALGLDSGGSGRASVGECCEQSYDFIGGAGYIIATERIILSRSPPHSPGEAECCSRGCSATTHKGLDYQGPIHSGIMTSVDLLDIPKLIPRLASLAAKTFPLSVMRSAFCPDRADFQTIRQAYQLSYESNWSHWIVKSLIDDYKPKRFEPPDAVHTTCKHSRYDLYRGSTVILK